MSRRAQINVLCVDDHELLMEGLAARMTLEPDLVCVGRLTSATEVVEKAQQLRAEVILLDIDMPGVNPLDRLIDLTRLLPDVAVVMLSAHLRDHYIDTALDRGAKGYFVKTSTPTEIFEGIRAAANGRVALGAEVQERLVAGDQRASAGSASRSKLSMLSPREVEVLRLVGRGMSRAEIARTFCRSLKTIDAQHTSIMKKLDIHDRAELTRFAIAEGLVEV